MNSQVNLLVQGLGVYPKDWLEKNIPIDLQTLTNFAIKGEWHQITQGQLNVIAAKCEALAKNVPYISSYPTCQKCGTELTIFKTNLDECLCQDCQEEGYIVCKECGEIYNIYDDGSCTYKNCIVYQMKKEEDEREIGYKSERIEYLDER